MGRACVFFGTPSWAVPSLDALDASEWEIAGVVTNPDRPAGRGHGLQASRVKQRALELGIEVRQPDKARDPSLQEWLTTVDPEAAVVVAYGKILPASLLAIPRCGFVNVHFSLLPEYRGAAPVQRAIADGRTRTGVAIMVLTEGMDEGPVLSSREVAIGPDETAGEVGERLAAVGAELLVPTLDAYADGRLEPREQDHERATYAPKVSPDEAAVDWTLPAQTIKDLVRALSPVPGAWTTFRGERFKLHRVEVTEASGLAPGRMSLEGGRWLVGTGEGAIAIEEAQMAGKRRMTAEDLARGSRPAPDETFG